MSTRHIPKATVGEEETTTVNVFVGLPGCGKTTACKMVRDAEHGKSVTSHEVSAFVRREYEKEVGGRDVGDNDLGEWAATKKTEEGNGYFVREMAEELAEPFPVSDIINIAGVRSPAEADAIRGIFTDSAEDESSTVKRSSHSATAEVRIITIWTLPDIRLQRLKDREGEYTVEEFNERKERELWDWGCIEFFTNEDYYDHIIPNNWDERGLRTAVEIVIDGHDAYDHEPWPDLSPESGDSGTNSSGDESDTLPSNEHVAQYL